MRAILIVSALWGCVATDDVAPLDGDGPEATDTDTEGGAPTDTEAPTDPCLAAGPASFELGTGEEAFVPLTEGQDLAMVHGGQGGWHHTLAVRGTGTSQYVKLLLAVVDDESGEVLALTPTQNVALKPSPDGSGWACDGYLSGREARLDLTLLGAARGDDWCAYRVLEGRAITLRATLLDEVGDELADLSIGVRSAPDPCDLDPFAAGCACDPARDPQPFECTGDDPTCEHAYPQE